MRRQKPLTDKVLRGIESALVSGTADHEGSSDPDDIKTMDDIQSAWEWLNSVRVKRRNVAALAQLGEKQ